MDDSDFDAFFKRRSPPRLEPWQADFVDELYGDVDAAELYVLMPRRPRLHPNVWTISTVDGCADSRGVDDEEYVLREAEVDAVTVWRAEQLLPYFESAVAFELAARRRLDVHELVRLVGCGATPEQAAALAEPVS